MPLIDTCCCGFSVKSGTKAIAILSTLYSMMGLLSVGTYTYRKDRILHSLETNKMIRTEDDKKKWELLFTAFSVFCSINFVVSLSLLMGVRLSKRWLLVPWIVWTGLMLALSQMAVFLIPQNRQVHHNHEMEAEQTGTIGPAIEEHVTHGENRRRYSYTATTYTIPDIFTTAFLIYCELCVISFFQTLSRDRVVPHHRRHHQTLDHSLASDDLEDPAMATPHLPTPLTVVLANPGGPLTVALPSPTDSDQPPAYRPPEDPPAYEQRDVDPPPPYPGSPLQDKDCIVIGDSETAKN